MVKPNPEHDEAVAVRSSTQVMSMVRRLGLPPQLLSARIAWERLHGDQRTPGAPTPSVAKSTLTLDSRRRWALARQRRRQSLSALLSSTATTR